MSTHSTEIVWQKNMAFLAHQDGHTFMIDASAQAGGEDSGMRPKALMLSALAGCTGIDVVGLLNKMRVPFSDFKIGVEASLTEEHPKMYSSATITYTIRVADQDRDKMLKAVELSEEKYCGVSAMFKKFAEVIFTVVFL